MKEEAAHLDINDKSKFYSKKVYSFASPENYLKFKQVGADGNKSFGNTRYRYKIVSKKAGSASVKLLTNATMFSISFEIMQ